MEYLGDLGIILMLIVLAVIILPILVGVGIAYLFGATNGLYYIIVILTAVLIWIGLYAQYFI